MDAKIVTKSAFTVVGMKYHGNDTQELPNLWRKFGPRVNEVKQVLNPEISYGVTPSFDEESGVFDYIAGVEVSSSTDVPQGMLSFRVPEGKYAVFTTTLPTFLDTFNTIMKVWLPETGNRRVPGGIEFELYDEKFDPSDPGSEFFYYFPIE